ncbi:MAG: phosphatidate cytidylyltransferase [Muribaculaceae bacterium]|nr:phosphatidate cytidylyltransferase [Muribaculaceae bacterium]
MKSVITRGITGVFFIVFVVWAIMYNPISLWALLAIITGVSLYEFYKILFKGEFTTMQYLMHISAGIYLTTILWLEATMVMEASESRAVTYAPYLLYVMIVFITELYAKHEEPFTYAAKSLAGHLYIALPVGLLSFIAFGGLSILSIYMPVMLLALLVIIWVYDTGAFVTGMTFGKHRLFERISPKKSWEGFWGGVAFALLAAWGIYAILENYNLNSMELYKWLGFALVVVVSATMGDLTESLLKRTYGVKDSGKILPGHGGMMDRFDSVFMAAPAAYIYLSLVM